MSAVRRILLPGIVGALLAAGVVVRPASTGAEELVAYEARAAAAGLQGEVVVPGAPLAANLFDGGAPIAQAVVDGLGTSKGFASLPYLGEAVSTLPGLLLPILGLPSLPPYPLTVATTSPNDADGSVGLPGIALRSTSEPDSSLAEARAGGGSTPVASVGNVVARADARLVDDGTAVVATATAEVQSLEVAGVLRVGSVKAVASVRRGADGAPTSESSFEVDGLRIAGLQIGVTDEGIVLPGLTVPVPDTLGLTPVLDALGLRMRLLDPRAIDGGVQTAGLEIRLPLPTALGEGTVALVLGRATATTSAAAPAPVVDDDGVAVDPGLGADPGLGGDLPTFVPGPAVDLGAAPVAGAPGRPAEPGPAVVPVAELARIDTDGIYLMLVLGAALGIVATNLLRLFGVKLAWTG